MSGRPNQLRFLIALITLLAVLHETRLLCSNIFANADVEVLFKQCTSGDLAMTVDNDACVAVPKDFTFCGVRPVLDKQYKCRTFNDAKCTSLPEGSLYFQCESLKVD
ncbi:MAG: hypothetical protein JOS17DRAFT_791363 [Linnemannia elongata]|nr:MAG: hypothetical protein JOS17DRAFT_791363 [Linnemannia elongata]